METSSPFRNGSALDDVFGGRRSAPGARVVPKRGKSPKMPSCSNSTTGRSPHSPARPRQSVNRERLGEGYHYMRVNTRPTEPFEKRNGSQTAVITQVGNNGVQLAGYRPASARRPRGPRPEGDRPTVGSRIRPICQ